VARGEGGRSICGSNETDGEPGQPEVELAKNGDGGGDLNRPGLLRCRGGGPREAAEDEGLPVLLGYRSGRTKGSTRARGGVAHRGRGGKGEGGRSAQCTGKEKRKGVGSGGLAPRGGERGGGAGSRQGTWPAEAVAGRCLPHEAGERVAHVGHT
jgi:hypothetical protein